MKIRDTIASKHYDEYYSSQDDGKLYACSANRTKQLLVFKIASEVGNLNDKSILDVGCGLGEFYYFCRANGIKPNKYVGIDLNLNVVKQANMHFPELNILHVDMMENNFDSHSFDYIITSLLFCFEADGWNERTQLLIKEMFRVSKIGMAINFLRWRKKDKNPLSHYVKYDDIMKIIEHYTNNFTIRADYKKNDFTVYIYKEKL